MGRGNGGDHRVLLSAHGMVIGHAPPLAVRGRMSGHSPLPARSRRPSMHHRQQRRSILGRIINRARSGRVTQGTLAGDCPRHPPRFRPSTLHARPVPPLDDGPGGCQSLRARAHTAARRPGRHRLRCPRSSLSATSSRSSAAATAMARCSVDPAWQCWRYLERQLPHRAGHLFRPVRGVHSRRAAAHVRLWR